MKTQEAVAKLDKWNFSRVRDYLAANAIYPVEEIPQVEVEYLRFIALAATKGRRIVMSKAVDDFWHTHVLFSQDYASMCDWLGVPFLHHEPTVDQKERDALQAEYDTTLQLYADEFGRPNDKYWAKGAQVCGCANNCSGCTSN